MIVAPWFVSGIDVLQRLAPRLEALGFHVVDAETADGARALVVSRNSPARAALVPTDFVGQPEIDLPGLLAMLRGLAPNRALTPVACGRAPTLNDRERLVAAGVALALYEPIDDGGLRFQVNRALAPCGPHSRAALRAPLDYEVTLSWRFRSRSARMYTVSSRGAFLLTDAPLPPGRRLAVHMTVGVLQPRARARVVLAHPPAEAAALGLPPGLAVAFEDIDGPSATGIDRLVGDRLISLAV
jgi:hypothetical protein